MELGRKSVKLDTGEEVTRPNVVGVGIGKKIMGNRETDELSIAVSVIEKLSERRLEEREKISPEIEGIKTDVDPVGIIRAPPTQVRRGRKSSMRPAKGGCSIGHYQITAGTFG